MGKKPANRTKNQFQYGMRCPNCGSVNVKQVASLEPVAAGVLEPGELQADHAHDLFECGPDGCGAEFSRCQAA